MVMRSVGLVERMTLHTNTLTVLFCLCMCTGACLQGDAKVERNVSETVTLCFVSKSG